MLRSPISPEEVALTRRPIKDARTLPGRAYSDPAVFAFEREAWFANGWVLVGRQEEAPDPGSYFLREVAGSSLLIVRDQDGRLGAFYNICRHRGAQLVAEPCGRAKRFVCRYHAWSYSTDGSLWRIPHSGKMQVTPEDSDLRRIALEIWQGFVFVNLAAQPRSFEAHLGSMPERYQRLDFASLRCAWRKAYDVRANWKIMIENFMECYHCPNLHPLINRLTPFAQGRILDGGYLQGDGDWTAMFMDIADNVETLSTDGLRHGRETIPGLVGEDLKRAYYFYVWPNTLLSLFPDYLMAHRLEPTSAGECHIVCEQYFTQGSIAQPGFDPSGPSELWSTANGQDREVCELNQNGVSSRGYVPGLYNTNLEVAVHAFDALVADRYADDGRSTPH